ncbi:aminotransferases class-i pyridoxal-phosphate attachment site [Lucifera butyrica]|uniref:Aminotransferase n=1 Tax=Lucifera butyrica TaxID=1351585 RepID=A0A498REY9_9FIRM|nr:pyridoxal phosphate-dependent aminotransferase [Lucifera butyrica]VBB09507.1 aminotransferases class-i pyridoxal-phosphate attachment site [Lucifera butyrica]
MVSEKMYQLGSNRSAIRELFEYGKMRAEIVGKENVYDFSLGNPALPPPQAVEDALIDLLKNEPAIAVHGYTSAQGDAGVRAAIANYLNQTYQTNFHKDNFYMTCGAAASLTICLRAIIEKEDDEVIVIAPFFPEYRLFAEAAGGKVIIVPPDMQHFQIHMEKLAEMITARTKAVIINSPNNPSGAVYSVETITALCKLLNKKSKENGRPIVLISDEPYREIVYDGLDVPYLTKYYANTVVCYSFSKSLSLPGERIGYILVPDEMEESGKVYAAVCGAGRVMGYVCAPSLFQKVVGRCIGQTSDIETYKRNRDLLYDGLRTIGYRCVKPQGAFYLFLKALEPDAAAFCEMGKKYDLLMVPGDSFGCPGYVRLSYCVDGEMIRRSLTAFQKLWNEYLKMK